MALISKNGSNINEQMVRAGYAWVYRKYCDQFFCSEWLQLEDKARNARIGLRQELNAMPPWGVAEEKIMAERLEKTEVVSVEDALQMEILVNQALIDILVDKGILNYEDILKRIKELKQETGTVLG